jgi:hypothetical protein
MKTLPAILASLLFVASGITSNAQSAKNQSNGAGPGTQVTVDDITKKLEEALGGQPELLKTIIDLYGSNLSKVQQLLDGADGSGADANASNRAAAQQAKTTTGTENHASQSAAGADATAASREVHVQPATGLKEVHLDGHTPLPNVHTANRIDHPTPQDIALRAFYEQAAIERYWFYKNQRAQQR